jgi:benzoate-CoA ligase
MLKVNGMWVSPPEVEAALIAHPAVLEAAVVGAEDADGLVKPKAFVVANPGLAAGDELAGTLAAHLRERLAPFKCPRSFVFLDELPKTATGKIQRFKLREDPPA